MKKIFALLLVLATVFTLAACGEKVKVMSHEEYIAAELDAEVIVDTYVQATQSWWEDKITVYCQSKDGAYFAY